MEDSVFIKIQYPFQSRVDLCHDIVHNHRPVALKIGIESGVEQPNDPVGHVRVAAQRIDHVVLAIAKADLAKKAKVAAQQRGFPPVQAGAQNEPVKAIVFRLASPCHEQRLFKFMFPGFEVARQVAAGQQIENMNPEPRLFMSLNRVGPFRVDLEPHVLYDRQNIGQWNWLCSGIQSELRAGLL